MLLCLAGYGLTLTVDPAIGRAALAAFIHMTRSIVPVLGLVFVLILLTEHFLTPARTRAWLGRDAGVRGWLMALAAGILSTGPVYVWYGLLAELRARGMRTALLAVVLYARAIKLPLLPLLAHYFGVTYMLVLSVLVAVFAVLSGLILERLAPLPEHE